MQILSRLQGKGPYSFYDPFLKRQRSTLDNPASSPHYRECPKCHQPWVALQRHLKKHHKPMRIGLLAREKAALIILRRQGYSINILSRAFSRSPSVIHRVLKRAYSYGSLKRLDMRKIPNRVRLLHRLYSWRKLMSLWSRWLDFMLSEEGEPP